MIRRILFLLVFLGLGFIVWRMISPTGANHALETLKALPGKIFSRDHTVDVVQQEEKQDEVLSGQSGQTELVIETGQLGEMVATSGETELVDDDMLGKNKEELEDLLSGSADADMLADALLDLVAQDQTGDLLSGVETTVSGTMMSGTITMDVETGAETDAISTGVEVENQTEPVLTDCVSAGHIALRTSQSTQCCDGLNWIYYRGDNKSAGVICFDMERGIPQCTHQNTLDEGRYYMDGGLLRKDLDCGKYFGTKYYELETTNDTSMLKSILTNIFK